MKNFAKILSLLLVLVMMVSVFAGCVGDKGEESQDNVSSEASKDEVSAETYLGADTLVYATSDFDQKFSPFFYSSVYDGEVVDLVHGYLLTSDREGNIITSGIKGQTVAYDGTDYTYYSIADLEIVENSDGSVDYKLTMRDDVKFSDGTPATIDDVIFGIYVEADPTYDGSSTIYALPIEGMEEYRAGMQSKAALMVAAGRDASSEYFTADEAKEFWADVDQAGAKFAKAIVDYCMENYADNGAVDTASSAGLWGFDLEEGATDADFFAAMVEAYEGDIFTLSDTETAGPSLFDLMENYSKFTTGVQTGESAANIKGIIKTGDYSMTVHCTEFDATAIYNMGFVVAPLHYYGDKEAYDYANNKFGFTKGDLSGVKSKTTSPMGCGPYTYEGYSNGIVTLKSNENYYKGQPKITYVRMVEAVDSEYIDGVKTGIYDIASPSISDKAVAAIKEINDNSELSGSVIDTVLVDYRGYGYMGINANLVKVGSESGSDESKALRLGLMTVLSVYRDAVIKSYYGDRAAVIQYPISNTSWAAPRPTDDGYKNAYSVDVDGNAIYSDDMSENEKYEAALKAALGYFEAAGYTVENGVVTAAPEGGKMEFSIMIPGQGEGDHPAYGVATAAKEALAKIGITVNVDDVGTSTWSNSLTANTCEIWAAAWQSTADPDMYQVYHSTNANGEGTNSNHYQITDSALDELIVKARKLSNNADRKPLYKQALETIISWGCELPLYQRKDCTIFSAARVNLETIPQDMTPYWGWAAEIENLEMQPSDK